jgi:O-antigen ligase
MVMTLWLLRISHSATSQVCLAIGCLTILAARSQSGKRRNLGFLKFIIPTGFILYLLLAFGLGLQGNFAQAVGRNATLTDRTIIWKILLSLHTNPVIGTGYESFWLGGRLGYVWRNYDAINEAHNGYLEIYLSLGLIGLFLVSGFLIASYRTICRRLKSSPGFGTFSLALWVVVLFYNLTEAALKFHLMWFAFLVGAIALPARDEARLSDTTVDNQSESASSHAVFLADVVPAGQPRYRHGAVKKAHRRETSPQHGRFSK